MNPNWIVPPWPGWRTTALLGRGGYGAVYRIERDNFGSVELAAMKVITIPQYDSDIQELYSEGYTAESVSERYSEHMKSIMHEYSMMAKLKGSTNVVYCDDVYQQRHSDGVGWDIFIRMELLTPLPNMLRAAYSEAETIRLGMDLARALAVCQKQNIIHRDIKPQNIFVSADGTFKLGDFGIAKVAERTSSGTKIGTYKYMAPEVYHDEPYGTASDVYSLGMVLYWMMNERRGPFVPLPPAIPKSTEEEQAKARRFAGEALPEPKNGSEALKALVLSMCAYKPEDRPSVKAVSDGLKELQLKQLLENAEEDLPDSSVEPVSPIVPDEDDEATIPPKDWMVPAKWNDDPTIPPDQTKADLEQHGQAEDPEGSSEGKAGAPSSSADPPAEREKNEQPAPRPKAERTAAQGRSKKPMLWIAAVIAVLAVGIAAVLAGTRQTEQTADVRQSAWADSDLQLEQSRVSISASDFHTVGLKSDGTVVAVGGTSGNTDWGQLAVSDWEDIVSVASGNAVTVGLKQDGTVMTAGQRNGEGRIISGWSDIVSISSGNFHTAGLKSDGTVIVAGAAGSEASEVSDWKDIIAISVGNTSTYGLKSDGTVISTSSWMTEKLSDWSDIVAIDADGFGIVGLKADGTVVVEGHFVRQEQVSDWTDIVAIAAGAYHVAGLKSDGTVVAVLCESAQEDDAMDNRNQCDVSDWEDIVAIDAAGHVTIGLKSDGTVVAVGENRQGQCNVSDWTDIMLP